jgi:2'-5' RNA ligase
MIRAFLALELGAALSDGACEAMRRLRESVRRPEPCARAKWVTRASLHLTLRFLGDIEEGVVEGLAAALPKLAGGPSPRLRASECVGLPNGARARVVALALRHGADLASLAAATEHEFEHLGFPAEPRAFRPHVTLARLRAPVDVRNWLSEPQEPVDGVATSLTLYRSELGGEAAAYTPLARAPFKT